MRESLDEAKEELKRVDHLLFVSLKYTRTVDVLLNTVNRMIEAYDRLIETLLRIAKDDGKIAEVPDTPRERVTAVKELYDDENIQSNVDLYDLLRKIHKSKHEKEREYRRHVTLRTFIDGREEIINIDICEEYYNFLMAFYNQIKEMIEEREE